MSFMSRSIRTTVVLLLMVLLSACGGGGGGPKPSVVNNDTTQTSLTMSLALVDANGQPVTQMREEQTFDLLATVQVRTVRLRDGSVVAGSETTAPAAGEIVTFTVGGGALTPASGTALTTDQGQARIRYTGGDDAGAYQLKASVSGTRGNATATVNVAIQEVLKPVLRLEILDRNGAIATTLRGGEIYTVRATAQRVESVTAKLSTLDPSKAAVAQAFTGRDPDVLQQKLVVAPNVEVTFATDGGAFEPATGRAFTDANGQATVRFRPNVIRASYKMTASATYDNADVVGEQNYSIEVLVFELGSFSQGQFRAGVLDVESPVIAAGGSTVVRATLRQSDGQLVQRPTQVTFSSPCVAAGNATLISPVTSSNGVAQTTFRARPGCVGTDTILARAQIEGLVFEAQASAPVQIQAPVAAGIEFVSATPTTIVLAGRGSVTRPETAEVRFRVRSAGNIPVPGQPVEFRLTSAAGGLRLESITAITDTNGEVVAVPRSGTAATVFRVVASLPGGASTQSDQLVVSTGTGDQNSFSLSISELNTESFGVDGVEVTLFARLSDLYNNPVPDGTNVLFTTEGGQITPSCATAAGACSVVWRSSNPRPQNGRVTILARTSGDESFVDANGDGQYSQGEQFSDLAEAFRDDDEDGVRDPGEFFSDTNGNGSHDGPNGVYDGLLCSALNCGRSGAVEIRDDIVHVLSTSRAQVNVIPNAVTVNEISPADIRIEVSDLNGNQMAPGTTVEISTTNGNLAGETSYEIGDSNGPGPFVATVTLTGDGTRSSGSLIAKVTSPRGEVSIGSARVEDTSICDQNFAPLPPGCGGTAGASQIGSIAVNPSNFLVRPNQTVVQQLTIDVRDSSTRNLPFANVVPSARCAAQPGQSGYVVNVVGGIQPTNTQGQTTARLEIQSSPIVSGQFLCTFTAGTKTATVTVTP